MDENTLQKMSKLQLHPFTNIYAIEYTMLEEWGVLACKEPIRSGLLHNDYKGFVNVHISLNIERKVYFSIVANDVTSTQVLE